MATRLLMTWEHAFCFMSFSVASILKMAPLLIALAPAFIDFMGGNMMLDKVKATEVSKGYTS